jgi:hypothetical protein
MGGQETTGCVEPRCGFEASNRTKWEKKMKGELHVFAALG